MTDRAKELTAMFVTSLGIAAIVVGGYLLATEPRVFDAASFAAHKLHYEIDGALMLAGALLVVPSQLASGIASVGGAVAGAWKAKKDADR